MDGQNLYQADRLKGFGIIGKAAVLVRKHGKPPAKSRENFPPTHLKEIQSDLHDFPMASVLIGG
jgi:hypothetical protein